MSAPISGAMVEGKLNPTTSWKCDLGEESLTFLICKMGMVIPSRDSKVWAQGRSQSYYLAIIGFPDSSVDKESTCQCRRCKRLGFDPWVRKIPWRRTWQSTPAFLPGEPHGRGEDWASQGQPKGKAEIPVVSRESRRNSRKITWFPPLGKMRPLPATASQGKCPVPP